MKLLVTSMSGNRPFTKALRRLVPKLKVLEESFASLMLDGEDFDDMVVSFVDASPGYSAGEVESRDRMYHADVPIPDHESYRPAEDHALLLEMVDELRKVFEAAPVKGSARAELLQQFSRWESAIRQQSLRAM